jgi:hypothetical protein
MAEALARSKAKKVFVVNIMTYEGETKGYHLPEFLQALDEHTFPHRVYDHVLVNHGTIETAQGVLAKADESAAKITPPTGERNTWIIQDKPARLVKYDKSAYVRAPFRLVEADIVNPAYPIRHDSLKLAQALMDILKN